MRYLEAAVAAEIAPGTMRRADVGGVKLLVANVDGVYHAMHRNCPHMGADLCRGMLDGRIVTCKLHEAAFDVTTGRQVEKPETRHLKIFPREPASFQVVLNGDKIMVGV